MIELKRKQALIRSSLSGICLLKFEQDKLRQRIKLPPTTSQFSLNPTNPENPQILISSLPQNPISPPALNLPLAFASPGSISMIMSTSWARLFSPRNLPSLVEWNMKMKLVVGWLFFSSMRSSSSMPARDTVVCKSLTI